MIISELNLSPIYFNQVDARDRLITKELSASSFSSMLNSIILDQSISAQEDVAQKASGTSCDCDKTEKCMCDSDNEATEAAETKKTGLAACIECTCRKAGECALWNGKEGTFDMLIGMSHNTSMDSGVSLSHNRLDFQPDFVAMAKVWLDYNNAYACITKKQLGILMLD